MIGALFRIYSYLYHLALGLLLLGMSLVAGASGSHTFQLGMLPWKGTTLTHWLFLGSLFGLVSILLACVGKWRFLFPLYALAAFGLMFRGYFLGTYAFSGKDEFQMALLLTSGALLAIPGALSQLWRKRGKRT